MRDREVLLRELAHPLTQRDALRLAHSFTSRSTLACREQMNVDLALSVHFSRSSIEGIIERPGPFLPYQRVSLQLHSTLTYNVNARMRVRY